MRNRLAPHLIAVGITAPFAVWIAVSDIRGVLPPAAWLLPLAAAYYLGLRIGREVVRGVRRARGEAPPGEPDGGSADGEPENTSSGAGHDHEEDVRTISLKRDREES